jgi:hypothetical protein
MILFALNEREQEQEEIFEMLLKELDEAVAALDYSVGARYPGESRHTVLGRFYAEIVKMTLREQYFRNHSGETETDAGSFFWEKMFHPTSHWARTCHEEHHLLLVQFVTLHVWPRTEALLINECNEAAAAETERQQTVTMTSGKQQRLFPKS